MVVRKTKKRGRPRLAGGRQQMNLTLPPYAKRWLMSRPISASAQVLAWVDAEIAKAEEWEGRAHEILARQPDKE